jgi:hypothetical protein
VFLMKKCKYDKDALLAEWRTGQYSLRDLSARHGLSHQRVHQLVKGARQNSDCRAEMTRSERMRYVRYFNSAGISLVREAMKRIRHDGISMTEMKQASEIVNGQRLGILGKNPETAVQVSNAAVIVEKDAPVSEEELARARRKIAGHY